MATPNLPDKSTTIKPPKLLDQVRDKLWVKHYAIRTEQTYVDWIKRYIYFHDKAHPKDLGAQEVEAFLTRGGGQGVCFHAEPSQECDFVSLP